MVSRTNLNFKFNSIQNCSLCEIKYGCWRFKALNRCSISWNRTSKYSGEKWRCSLNSSSIDGCGHNCEAVPRGMIMFILIVFIISFGRKIICLKFWFLFLFLLNQLLFHLYVRLSFIVLSSEKFVVKSIRMGEKRRVWENDAKRCKNVPVKEETQVLWTFYLISPDESRSLNGKMQNMRMKRWLSAIYSSMLAHSYTWLLE